MISNAEYEAQAMRYPRLMMTSSSATILREFGAYDWMPMSSQKFLPVEKLLEADISAPGRPRELELVANESLKPWLSSMMSALMRRHLAER